MKNHYKFWIVLSFLVVFVAGIFSGAIIERQFLSKKLDETFRKPPRKERQGTHFPTLDDMAKELELTSQQQGKIQEIFDNSEDRLKTLRKEVGKQFMSMREQFMQEIKSVFDQDQTVRFDAMIEKYLSQRKEQIERKKNRSNNPQKEKGERK
jgi:RNase adaptor protein for sRNA GlmZ degradation